MADKDWRLTMQATETGSGALFDSTMCVRDHTSTPLADPLGAETVAEDLTAWLGAYFRATFPSGLVHQTNYVYELGTSEPASANRDVGIAGTLPGGTNALPRGVCPFINLKTAVSNRTGRGGFHTPWPVFASYLLSGVSWGTNTTLWTALNNLTAQLANGHDVEHDQISHHYSIRVWSRKLGISRDVITFTPRQEPKFVRSRMTAP